MPEVEALTRASKCMNKLLKSFLMRRLINLFFHVEYDSSDNVPMWSLMYLKTQCIG